jgi:hypothetical protein
MSRCPKKHLAVCTANRVRFINLRTVGGALIALALKDIRKAVTDIVRATLGFWMKARPATKPVFQM